MRITNERPQDERFEFEPGKLHVDGDEVEALTVTVQCSIQVTRPQMAVELSA